MNCIIATTSLITKGGTMQVERTGMNRYVALCLILMCSAVRAENHPQFTIKESHRDGNGVTMRTSVGMMRIEVCDDRVIHVVASRTSEIPAPLVPVVTRQCQSGNAQVKIAKKEITVSTAAVAVNVNAVTGALSFLSPEGKVLLAEPKNGGKSFDVPSIAEMNTWQVQQTFLSSADEALYGLGQHQEGIFDVRGVPIRLHQGNTNISIPFLLSSKGYGLLWNNSSLTDFNPPDQAISIDPNTGKGKFTTGTKGNYGFLLSSDNRDQLKVEVDGHHVIDLQNEWTPSSASGVIALEAGKEVEVLA